MTPRLGGGVAVGYGLGAGGGLVPSAATIRAEADFEDDTLGDFTAPWPGSNQTILDDPTGAGRSKVLRIIYSPTSGNSDNDAAAYNPGSGIQHDTEYWWKGDVYQEDRSGVDADYDSTHNRKLIDIKGDGQCRITLHRVGAGDLRYSIFATTGGELFGSTGVTLNDDTWYTLELRVVTNSSGSDNATIELYVDGSSTPDWTYPNPIELIDPAGGEDLLYNEFGQQLTIDMGDAEYDDYRYWDNLIMTQDGRPS